MDMETLTINGTVTDYSTPTPEIYMNGTTPTMNGSYSPTETLQLNGDSTEHQEETPATDTAADTAVVPTELPTEVPVVTPDVAPVIVKGAPPTYADAFPPLPAGPAPTPSSKSAWGAKTANKVKQQPAPPPPVISSSCNQVFKIPYEERKYKNLSPIVGDAERQSETILGIMSKTGTTIEVSVTKDQCLTVMISGKREATAEARRLVVGGLQAQASIEMVIPKDHHRYILGKGGKKLQELELSTQTRITIPRDSEIIRIVGTKEGIDRARHEMQLVSDEQAKLAFERLNIPKIYHPFICGPENENAKEIANTTGARINIPPPSVHKDELTVAGEIDGVQKAVAMIMKIYQDKEKNSKTVSVEVKKSQHRYVIGPRGAAIQEILRATGVSVEMPPLESDNETITLRGDGDKLGNALTLVYEKANSIVQSELDAPRWLHRFIIGRKGQNIRKITQDLENKVHVEFVEDKDKILIQGPPTEVQAAENLLSSSLIELKNTMSFADIEVDPKWHRHIIGKNGSNIGRIKTDTGTSINIPSDTTKSPVIRIEGSPEGVAAAKEEILEMAKKFDNEKSRDIIIEHKYHKNIIGQKGEKVREIRERFSEVQISFPESDAKSDIVTLRGPKDDVDKCYDYMKKLSVELIASSFKLGVPIFKRFHGNVIGRGGANIKKIKEETNTIIDIPAENNDSDVIYVQGYKADAEKARDMILAIQNELANIVTSHVSFPQKIHTSMIGPGGKLIQSIMAECGDVHIRFPAEGEDNDNITIRGTKEDVAKAEEQLMKLGEERVENSFTAEVTAKPEHHRFLIGRGGVNIRKVREKTGVRIVFPSRQDENQELITIIGKKEAVEEAKADLMSKISQLNNITESELSVDPKHHRHFVARRAQVLNDISDEFGGVNISLPKDQSSPIITLKGARECVEGAKKRLLEIVSDLESMTEIKCVISQKHHRALLGNKGKNIQELTARLNIQIKFPERKRNDEEVVEGEEPPAAPTPEDLEKADTISISGHKDRCEEAKQALLALVPISVPVDIPFENHRYIIGQKGAGIRKMMEEFDVNIAVPPPENQEATIVVTGAAANVANAVEGLKERNEDIEKENEDRKLRQFELVINVAAEYHPKLIGRKGAVISKLRETHGVNIQVPPNSSSPDEEKSNQIRIIGYEQNCMEAKEAISAIIGELEDQVTLEVSINNQIHSRIIGQKGRTVRKLMEQFKTDIRFPKNPENPDLVLVTGTQEHCEACIEHLCVLEEEHMDEVYERNEQRSMMQAYIAPSRNDGGGGGKDNASNGYVVADAPWSRGKPQHNGGGRAPPPPASNGNTAPPEYIPDKDDAADFPSLGGKSGHGQQNRAWGPWGGQ
jgi:transcription antitermination factor NusA-like protein